MKVGLIAPATKRSVIGKTVLKRIDWSIAELAWAETAIFLALSCVAEHCPSRKYRAFAQVQLLNPWWDLQRIGRSRIEQLADKEGR